MKHTKIKFLVLFCLIWQQFSYGQSVISVGSGSYASYPPDYEYVGSDESNGSFYDFATNTDNIDVASSKKGGPIPTNDWWTSILTDEDDDGNRHGGNLWTYPLISRATTDGYEIGYRGADEWYSDDDGSVSLGVDYLVKIIGSSFTPTKTIAVDWSDWHLDLRTQVGDDESQRIDVTLVQGMPYVWAKTYGFDPIIQAYHSGVRTYYDESGNELSFPTTTDRFIIEYDNNLYGVHLEESVTIESSITGLSLGGYADKWIVISALNSVSELNTLHTYAFVRPTSTSLDYSYDPDAGTVTATYNLTTETITGSQTNALQGFIPHHYRDDANSFSFSGLEYSATARGTVKMATGTSFEFIYEFNADLLPHFKEPEIVSTEDVPYDPDILDEIIDDYASDIDLYGISGGTYWGGKNLVRLIKYALMAKESGNDNYDDLLTVAKEKVYDWLTFTPDETNNYYSYYSGWKALIGFDEEYYSAYFTDNHFHYGYLAHACALLEIAEPGSMDGYWDMITLIVKTYANWDRTDTYFPYFRTFSPWMGHSFASGLGNTIGNNQESSSEAMQAWAGMFMIAEITGDTDMRDAAAFGYLTEGRAIADYWYNKSGVFEEVGYDKPITGILEMNRYVYGTFFGAQDTYIHGIQWLPISPAYGFWNDFLTTDEANAIVDPIIANMETDLDAISADWMNVCLGFKLFFDPEEVVSIFDGYWNSSSSTDEYTVAHTPGENGLTYYYAHASQNLGLRQSNYRLSMPLSSAFENDGLVNYVVYNPSSSDETCNVYKDGTLVSSFTVPANTLYSSNSNNTDSGTSDLRIEAEDYSSMSGIATGDSEDEDGTDYVGWIGTGDYMEYSVTIPESGTYSVDYRVASLSNGGDFTLTTEGETLEDVTFDATGGWLDWASISSSVYLSEGTQTIKISANNEGWNINWFEFTLSEASISFVPDPDKTYYIDCPALDLRISASGESPDASTTTTSTTGDDVEWKFTDKGNGYWHLDRAAGGSIPRLRTDNSQYADMQATTSSGSYTYYEMTTGASSGTYFFTLVDGPASYNRLQVNSSGLVKMVASSSNESNYESFTISEITNSTTESCSITGSTGDFTAEISDDASNPTLTFIPTSTGTGSTTCILYYGTSETGTLGGQSVDPNEAYQINASNGETIYFYYTYSLSTGGENNTSNNRNSFTVGDCSTLKIANESVSLVNETPPSVYPNPLTNQLYIDNGKGSTLEVYDRLGKLLVTDEIAGNTYLIDLSPLNTGIYFLRIINNGQIYNQRIIKN